MELEGSLPHSQVPTTYPYPEPARFSPYFHIPLPEDSFNIITCIFLSFKTRHSFE